jgi:hypothetical protein
MVAMAGVVERAVAGFEASRTPGWDGLGTEYMSLVVVVVVVVLVDRREM